MRIYLVLALLLLVSQPPAILLSIDSSGVVEAEIKLMVSEGLNEVKLPAEPIPETIEVQVDDKTLIPIYDNGSLYFFSPTPGEAEITYLVNITAEDSIFSFEILGENLTSLKISPQIILLSAPEKVERLEYVDDELLIKLYGPEEIEYAVRRPSTLIQEKTTKTEPTTPETATSASVEEKTTTTPPELTTRTTGSVESATTTTEFATRTSPITTIREQAEAAANYYWIMVAAMVIVPAAALLAFFFSRRRGEEHRALSSVDRMILERIMEAGGSILQGELQSELMIPKTTLWRHVKKLEKLGYIQIVKEGPFNRLILVRGFR
ncbi:MAG: hypothetical protein DRN54_04155 [Thaumarchaeota archaeon]|nr:MAG: hypothetical protein DRN54_04155 [Nitrososphaerota archaeon]